MKDKPSPREIIKQLNVITEKWNTVLDTPRNFIIKLEKKQSNVPDEEMNGEQAPLT